MIGSILIFGWIKVKDKQSKTEQYKEESEAASVSPLIAVLKLEKQAFVDEVKGISGKIDAPRSELSFEVNGVIERIYVKKGDQVQKGDLLMVCDRRELTLKEQYKKNQLEGAHLELKKALKASISLLRQGGRLVVVSFHSLEDKIVKSFLKKEAGLDVSVSRYQPEITSKKEVNFRLPKKIGSQSLVSRKIFKKASGSKSCTLHFAFCIIHHYLPTTYFRSPFCTKNSSTPANSS